MHNSWSHLLVVFGLAAPLVTASFNETAAMTSPTPTTLVTASLNSTDAVTSLKPVIIVTSSLNGAVAMNSSTPTTIVTMTSVTPAAIATPTKTSTDSVPTETPIESLSPVVPTETFTDEVVSEPVPTTSPTISVVSATKVADPTPGSVGILNGIPTRVLNGTTPVKADLSLPSDLGEPSEPPIDNDALNQPWNTSYPGPIHEGDWLKYLQVWDPIWWSRNLDSLRQTSCTCSADDFYTNPQAQIAAYMNFEYYSHQLGKVYAFVWACGPTESAMSIHERVTSGKHLSEHCWSMAGGEYPDDHRALPMDKQWFCNANEELCVKPWRYGRRELKFQGHKRNYDRDGVHTWSEIRQVVADVCEPICKDKFLMKYDDFSHHNPSFVTTFFPPKPIDLTIIGD